MNRTAFVLVCSIISASAAMGCSGSSDTGDGGADTSTTDTASTDVTSTDVTGTDAGGTDAASADVQTDDSSVLPDAGGGGSDGGPDTEYPINVTFSDRCPFEACGGNVVGHWRYSSVCLPPPNFSACPTAMVRATGTGRGGVVITSTNITRNITVNIVTTVTIPAICLAGTSCMEVQSALRSGGYPDATCAMSGANCECTFSQTSNINDDTTYTTSGNTLTTGTGQTYEYCSRMNMIRYRQTGGSRPEPGVATLVPR